MRISDWSSDVCSSDLIRPRSAAFAPRLRIHRPIRKIATRGEATNANTCCRYIHKPWKCWIIGAQIAARSVNTKTGRASSREGVCQYGSISGVVVSLKKQKNTLLKHIFNYLLLY